MATARSLLPLERQKAIVSYLAEEGFASVEELCRKFGVSEMTIRRDLSDLDQQGLLQRTYGGATRTDRTFFEVSLMGKVTQFVEEKGRIGKAAAEMVREGEAVILDAGSTTSQVAQHLGDLRLTIITNALNIASELLARPQTDVLMPGGILTRGPLALVGPHAIAFFQEVRADKLFLGVEGVDAGGGITVPDVIEAHTKRAMVKSARETIVVADHSKLGRITLNAICPLDEVGMIITGVEAAEEVVAQLKRSTRVLQV